MFWTFDYRRLRWEFMSLKLPNRISLAQWSLHRMLNDGELTATDFPKMTREVFGLDAVEYVNSFYRKWANDEAYFRTWCVS